MNLNMIVTRLFNLIQNRHDPFAYESEQPEGILDIVDGQVRSQRNPFRCDHIPELAALHPAGFDIPLGDEPFQMPVYRPYSNPKLQRQRSLCCFRVFFKVVKND